MRKFIARNWMHELLWLLMISYFIFAPTLYAKYYLKKGAPIQSEYSLTNFPQETKNAKYAISDEFNAIVTSGGRYYKLSGWSFIVEDMSANQSDYERTLVLKSDTSIYFFSVTTTTIKSVQDTFPNINMDLTRTGFNTFIARDLIAPGKYRIMFIFKHKTSGESFIKATSEFVIRTPNRLILEKD